MAEQKGIQRSLQSTDLAEILERILDKGIVIAGDIKVQLVEVELLTIKLRLLIASVDKAMEIGIDWWKRDSYLTGIKPRNQIRNPKSEIRNKHK